MKIYNKIQTFTCDKEMKDFLNQLKREKVNVSGFIRDSIEKNKPIQKKDNRKKATIEDFKKQLNQIF
jgi:peroxiredoxin